MCLPNMDYPWPDLKIQDGCLRDSDITFCQVYRYLFIVIDVSWTSPNFLDERVLH